MGTTPSKSVSYSGAWKAMVLKQSPLILGCFIFITVLVIQSLLNLSQPFFWLFSMLCGISWGYLTASQLKFRSHVNQMDITEKKLAESLESHQRLKIRYSGLEEHMQLLLQEAIQPLQSDITCLETALSKKDDLEAELANAKTELVLKHQLIEDIQRESNFKFQKLLRDLEVSRREALSAQKVSEEKAKSKVHESTAKADEFRSEMAAALEAANQRAGDLEAQLGIAKAELLAESQLIEDVQRESDFKLQQLLRDLEESRRESLSAQKAVEEKAKSMVHESTAKADELREQIAIMSDELIARQQRLESIQLDSEQTIRKLVQELDGSRKESAILLESISAEAIAFLSEANSAEVKLQSQNSSLTRALHLIQKASGEFDKKFTGLGELDSLPDDEREFLISTVEQLNKQPDTFFTLPIDDGSYTARLTSAFEAIKTTHRRTSDNNSFVSKRAEELRRLFEEELRQITQEHGRADGSQYQRQHAANHFLADLRELLFQKVDARNLDFCKASFFDAVNLVKESGIIVTDYQVACAISDLECEHENEKRVEEMRAEKVRKILDKRI